MEKPQNYPNEPAHLWNHFFDFTQVPRPSKEEVQIRNHVKSLAEKYGHSFKEDEEGNIVIYVPASKGYEHKGPVIIQNHLDMVTDSTPDRKINFSKDPIVTYVEGDWLKADRTTLGADNGIGCAAALALMTDESVKHPPLELLFTTDEETGLNGAWAVKSEFFKGKKMLNLDTEEWGSLYIGCAGGIDKQLNKKIELVEASKDLSAFKITLGGLRGGHSGVDIHMQLANAIKKLNEYLLEIGSLDYEIAEFRGGRAHNIIPRDAYVIIKTKENNQAQLQQIALDLTQQWKKYQSKEDSQVFIEIQKIENNNKVLSGKDKNDFLSFISLFPHGVHTYLLHTEDRLVALSNNLAQVIVMNGHIYAMASIRFFDREEARMFEKTFDRLAHQFGFDMTSEGEYPSWKPAPKNELLDFVKTKYQEQFGATPKVTAIHAGLECGILRDRIGPIDAVSFGPTIMGAHSPQERVQISTVRNFWLLLKNIIESL